MDKFCVLEAPAFRRLFTQFKSWGKILYFLNFWFLKIMIKFYC